jgi:hypothetical protein
MKEIFKNAFSWKTLEPFVLGVSSVLFLEFLIFPGLSVANTFLNLVSAVGLIGVIIFVATYLKNKLY